MRAVDVAASRRHRGGRPSIPPDVRALISPMSREIPLWGAPRIHRRTPSRAQGGDRSRIHDVPLIACVLKVATPLCSVDRDPPPMGSSTRTVALIAMTSSSRTVLHWSSGVTGRLEPSNRHLFQVGSGLPYSALARVLRTGSVSFHVATTLSLLIDYTDTAGRFLHDTTYSDVLRNGKRWYENDFYDMNCCYC